MSTFPNHWLEEPPFFDRHGFAEQFSSQLVRILILAGRGLLVKMLITLEPYGIFFIQICILIILLTLLRNTVRMQNGD